MVPEKDKRILLRKEHIKVGTVFLETNRFKPEVDWVMYLIETVDFDRDKMGLSVISTGFEKFKDLVRFFSPNTTRLISASINAHTKHDGHISYYMPAGSVLYGRKEIQKEE